MRYLGVDYGTKRVGIAVSDAQGKFAFPRAVLQADAALDFIRDIVREEGIETVVIGDTRSLSGAENPVTKDMEAFKQKLSALSIPVETMWEAWSSHEAARFAPKEKDDSAAAAIILQRYLDMRKS